MTDHAERLAKLQLRQASRQGQPAPAPAAPVQAAAASVVAQATEAPPAPVSAQPVAATRPERAARAERPARKKRPHAAAPARIIVTALAASVFVMLMTFMGPLAKLNETDAATATETGVPQPIVVQIRREVAAAPPDPSLGLPGHLNVNGEPIDLAFLEEFTEDEGVALVTGGPVAAPAPTATPAPTAAPAAPVAAAPATPAPAAADPAAPAPTAAPATTAPPPPAPTGEAPPPRTEASG